MANPFDTTSMASGYATARPPVHPRVMELAQPALLAAGPLARALDVGCGAGLSTRALFPYAGEVHALDPVAGMFEWRRSIAPAAHFVMASAEAMPFAPAQFDLLAAAGSLNFVDLDRFFPEALRVLRPTGRLFVYDYSHGRSFPDSGALDAWFETFIARYPRQASKAKFLNPEILSGLHPRFRLHQHAEFAIGITLTVEFYVEYLLTSTNVAAALRRGDALDEIRQWCHRTLEPVWPGEPREVVFRGYYALLEPRP